LLDADVRLVEALIAERFVQLQDPALLRLGLVALLRAAPGFADALAARLRGARFAYLVLRVLHSR
jgi:hypothetical protein